VRRFRATAEKQQVIETVTRVWTGDGRVSTCSGH
jgi:hypothetical protein